MSLSNQSRRHVPDKWSHPLLPYLEEEMGPSSSQHPWNLGEPHPNCVKPLTWKQIY